MTTISGVIRPVSRTSNCHFGNQSTSQFVCNTQNFPQAWFSLQGFSEEVLSVLRKTSETTSEEQLRSVLQEALTRGHIKRADTKDMAAKIMVYLDDPESDLRNTMANLKPLQYT
jgi:hypothetical protein